MTTKSWYKIILSAVHEDDDEDDTQHAEILIYDEIGKNWFGEGISAEDMVLELAALDVESISVRINSVGGQVFEGLAIHNALARHPAEVTTHVDGMAASIASIVALAGDEVRIAENAFMMIHNPWGMEMGDANDMRKMADILDKLAGSLAEIYSAKTESSLKAIRALMDAETWFNAEESLKLGLVDGVDDAMDIAASFDLSRFVNVPAGALERVARRDGGVAGNIAAHLAGLQAIEDETARIEAATRALEGNGPDPELVRLAAEVEETLSRTML